MPLLLMKGGKEMATKLKRFTISVTPNMEVGLDSVKKEYFYNTTQTEMIRELIIRGLDTLMNDSEDEKNS